MRAWEKRQSERRAGQAEISKRILPEGVTFRPNLSEPEEDTEEAIKESGSWQPGSEGSVALERIEMRKMTDQEIWEQYCLADYVRYSVMVELADEFRVHIEPGIGPQDSPSKSHLEAALLCLDRASQESWWHADHFEAAGQIFAERGSEGYLDRLDAIEEELQEREQEASRLKDELCSLQEKYWPQRQEKEAKEGEQPVIH